MSKDSPVVDDSRANSLRPLIFGEVLFDHFADGRKVLGGAPFNVAWNLQGLGFRPFFVSGIGDDAEAEQVRRRMSQWGMDDSGLQQIDDRPTGRVTVRIVDNQPSYQIDLEQAYDGISDSAVDPFWANTHCGLLYHGSLIFRGERSRNTLKRLIAETEIPRFVDINIRHPHFDHDWLPDLLTAARWIKLNDAELEELSGVEIGGRSEIESAIAKMRGRFGPATYLVTLGSRGACLVEADRWHEVPAPPPEKFQDTVGAGDAFAAATIGGLIQSLSPEHSLRAGVRLASRVCELNGATTTDRSCYQEIYG